MLATFPESRMDVYHLQFSGHFFYHCFFFKKIIKWRVFMLTLFIPLWWHFPHFLSIVAESMLSICTIREISWVHVTKNWEKLQIKIHRGGNSKIISSFPETHVFIKYFSTISHLTSTYKLFEWRVSCQRSLNEIYCYISFTDIHEIFMSAFHVTVPNMHVKVYNPEVVVFPKEIFFLSFQMAYETLMGEVRLRKPHART